MSVSIPARIKHELQQLGLPVLTWHRHYDTKWATYKPTYGRPAWYYEIEVGAGSLTLYYKEEGGAYRQTFMSEPYTLAPLDLTAKIIRLIGEAQAHHTSIQEDK